MDGITQALLGASVGYAACGHKLHRKAAWWGAFGGIVPDLDMIAAAPFDAFTGLWMHRGTSHGLWFGWVVGPLLGYAIWRYYRRKSAKGGPPKELPDGAIDPGAPEALRWWALLFALAIFTHPLLDVFTSYGTQLLAPFDRTRFVLDGVGIIDPAYSLVLVACLLWARRRRQTPRRAQRILRIGLAITTSYVLIGAGLSYRAQSFAKAELEAEGVTPTRVEAYTQPLTIGLKRLVAQSEDTFYIGYISAVRPSAIHWWSFPRDPATRSPGVEPELARSLTDKVAATERGQIFTWFSDEHISAFVEPRPDGGTIVTFDDVRYGWPGKPERGFWGIRAEVDASHQILSVERINREREIPDGAFGDLFRAAFGHDPRTFMVGVGRAPSAGAHSSLR